MSESCDVVVIGGGPGGSATATLLADDGLKVVLLERTTFPREHVGESLLPASIPVLEKLGVMPAVEAAGFVTKRGATLVWGKDADPWSWYFADDPEQRPTSFQVVRPEFDKILLDNARARGVDVREEHHVLDVDFEGDRAHAVRFLHDGDEGRIEARFVVDASGQAAIIGRKRDLRQWDTFFRNLAVYGYYTNAKHLDPPNDGNIFIESFAHGWLWKIPLHTGVTSVGVVVDQEVAQEGLREHGAQGFLEAHVAQAPHMRELLAGATFVGEANIERDWSYSSSSFAGDGFVLVGDAACFVDPLFSSGVHLALGGATLAATYVRSALSNPASREQAAQAYQSVYEKQYQYFHLTAQLFYGSNRSADSYFWEARRILGDDDATPRAAFVKIVGGQPPQGYERAVIERGELPTGLADEIHRMEDWFKDRKQATDAMLQDPTALLRAVPTLPGHVRLEQKPILGQPHGHRPPLARFAGAQLHWAGPHHRQRRRRRDRGLVRRHRDRLHRGLARRQDRHHHHARH
ncbi:MAG: clorobiocin biosynthesis protein Clo-hal/halogenation protein CepH [Chloroflexi bacterium]|nr:MAG: clorobiocin biosynthesis protein Clo-hal/halogenation protein CepH [Chloroflexota bacterium]